MLIKGIKFLLFHNYYNLRTENEYGQYNERMLLIRNLLGTYRKEGNL